MIFDGAFTIGDIAACISCLGILVGGGFALYKWIKNNKVKRNDYLLDFFNKIRCDEDVSEMFYKIEYEENWYNSKFPGSDLEIKMDKALSYFNYVCYLYLKHIIDEEQFGFVKYLIVRVLQHKDIPVYLNNLKKFSHETLSEKTTKTPTKDDKNFSFRYLLEYGIKAGYLQVEYNVLNMKTKVQ